MEVRYVDRKIEKICTNEREMKRKLSQAVAKRLRLRIAELYNAESFDDLLQGTGRWETLSGDRAAGPGAPDHPEAEPCCAAPALTSA